MVIIIQIVMALCVFIMAVLPVILFFKKRKIQIDANYKPEPGDNQKRLAEKQKYRRIEIRNLSIVAFIMWAVIETFISYAFNFIDTLPGIEFLGNIVTIPLAVVVLYFEFVYYTKFLKKINETAEKNNPSDDSNVNKVKKNESNDLRDRIRNGK